jgi:hypothetical protein
MKREPRCLSTAWIVLCPVIPRSTCVPPGIELTRTSEKPTSPQEIAARFVTTLLRGTPPETADAVLLSHLLEKRDLPSG